MTEKIKSTTEKNSKVTKKLDPEKLRKINKKVKKIRRENDLYFEDSKGTLKRLDKISQNLFDLVMVKFILQNGQKIYTIKNKGKISGEGLKPISQIIEKKYAVDFIKLKVAAKIYHSPITIFLNDVRIPLVNLTLEE